MLVCVGCLAPVRSWLSSASWGICGCLITGHAHQGQSFGGHKSVDCIHPSSHPPVSHLGIYSTVIHLPAYPPTHLSTTHPPTQAATYTTERQTVEHSTAAPYQQPGWQVKVALPCEGAKDLATSLGAAGICFGEPGPTEIHQSVTDSHLPRLQGLINIYTL